MRMGRVSATRQGIRRIPRRNRAEWSRHLDRQATRALARDPRVLHVIRERDVGLFSLIQQVVANVSWALSAKRCPVVDFRDRTAYWTPGGYHGAESVWEYYFEPVLAAMPSSVIPVATSEVIDRRFPEHDQLGFFATPTAYASSFYGAQDHPSLFGITPVIPYETGNPAAPVREWTSAIMARFVRPRPYVLEKVERFFDENMAGRPVVGVHVRGTDAVSPDEKRAYRQGSLNLDRFEREIGALVDRQPGARIFVATDEQALLDRLSRTFDGIVVAYDAVRHLEGEAAGRGPSGYLMPAYIAADRGVAAQNGEDAVVEYLLLGRCQHLVHNGAGLATTVLLRDPDMPHTNTHRAK
jgi:hypothetical protein